MQAQQDKMRSDMEKAATDMKDKLMTSGITLGSAKPDAHLIAFFDPMCPHCHDFYRLAADLVEKRRDLAIHIIPVAILGPNSVAMAKILLATSQQGVDKMNTFFLKFINKTAEIDRAKLLQMAKDSGIDVVKMEKDELAEATEKTLVSLTQLAEQMKIPGKTDDSDFDTPLENKAKSLSDPRIQALLGRSDFTFTPAYKPIQKISANPASKRTGKENIVNGSEGVLKGAWYRKPETGNWVLNLGSVKGYATIIPGSIVKENDLLFTLDDESIQAQLRQAEANLSKNMALFEDAKIEANMKSLEGATKADQAAIDLLKVQLGYTKIHSPITGLVGFRKVVLGNYVRTEENTPLVSVVKVDPLEAVFNLPERPVMTTLITLWVVMAGMFGFWNLPISALPKIEFPVIQVTASLPGANPVTMAQAVALPLEQQFSSIPGLEAMTSTSAQGTSLITLQFALDVNINAAAQDVGTAISTAQVSVIGEQKYAVRVYVRPEILKSRNLSLATIANVIAQSNINAPTGLLQGPVQVQSLTPNSQLKNAAEFAQIMIPDHDGLRLKDVAEVVDDVQNTYSAAWFDNERGIILAVSRQPGSNTLEVAESIKSILPALEKQLPESIKMTMLLDRSEPIQASVNDATLIPTVTLPISMIATFALMSAFGFSLNNLTLLALTLATGFIIDDAIVVLENIARYREQGLSSLEATLKGTEEIGFTVISMTLSLVAVFIPILFMPGIRQTLILAGTGIIFIINVAFYVAIPKGFFPNEDTGLIYGVTDVAPEVSFDAMAVAQKKKSIEKVMDDLREKFSKVPDVTVSLQAIQNLRVGGTLSKSQYQYTIQVQNLEDLSSISSRFVDTLSKTPGFLDVNSDLQINSLQVNVKIDRDRASYFGITIACIPYVDKLIEMGVNDWRLKNLPTLYQNFMNQESLLKADGMLVSEIEVLKKFVPRFQSLCEKLSNFSIPETLEHGDFHDNNCPEFNGYIAAALLKRYKRFFADIVLDDGTEITAHCPNPGAMLGVLNSGNKVAVTKSDNPARKLGYTWQYVEAEGTWVGVNTHLTNEIVADALTKKIIPELSDYTSITREVKYGINSRIDFLLSKEALPPCYLEVKNVHLKRGGVAQFPDCVTLRGAKHMTELAAIKQQDPTYAKAASLAKESGVEMLVYACEKYFFSNKYLQNVISDTNVSEASKRKLVFYLKGILDALSPTNFAFTNPVVIRESLKRKGDNLVEGYQKFIKDQTENGGAFRLPSLDKLNAFKIKILDKHLKTYGVLAGDSMVKMFSSMRANDLIWSNYINHYLLAKETEPLDFLYWNSDTTHLPAKMHLEYLKKFFLGNAFIEKKGFQINKPAILGYILSGIILGPSGFALIHSRDQVGVLAELGVLLLLFVVGMELSLRTFKKVWGIATLFSSTAVVVKMLESLGELKSETGQLTIGILIAQDLAIVPMILILRNYGESWFNPMLFVKVLGSIGMIVALINYLSRRQPAAVSGLIGLSAPYGAFLAGLVLGNTHERVIMLETIKPVQSILMMAFFLSIGLLLDIEFIWQHMGTVLLLLFVITIGKTALNIAQLGEFAFLMATISNETHIINEFGERLIIGLTVLSLAFSPLWLASAKRLRDLADANSIPLQGVLNALSGEKENLSLALMRLVVDHGQEIDQLNIGKATRLAMARAVQNLNIEPSFALVDGIRAPELKMRVQTVVKGDQQSFSIAAASIIAKVTRDYMMTILDEKYPCYGWKNNAGYGTKIHHEAMKLYGLTVHHRLSYAPVKALLERAGKLKIEIVDRKNLENRLPPEDCEDQNQRVVVLDHVNDPHNVGAILRSAAVFGAKAVIMTERHAPKESGVLAKSASGALEVVPMCIINNLAHALRELKELGFWCIGFAESGKKTLAELDLKGKTALIFGGEGDGMRRLTTDLCDFTVRLPSEESFSTLNVSNAAAVGLYEVYRQQK
eukprot:gene14768-14898_t